MLKVDGLSASYGQIKAVTEVTMTVNEGEMVALLGANGAGKTTTLACIMGLINPGGGAIKFKNHDITNLSPEDTVRRGIAISPEGRQVLRSLTVQENLMLGATPRKDRTNIKNDIERMFNDFPVLKERSNQFAGTLSGGEAQQLAIARALMSKPSLLLLDEPTLGLAPKLVSRVFEIVTDLKKSGLTILLVDQNATRSMNLADRTYVMRRGRVVVEGSPTEIGGAEGLSRAYMGSTDASDESRLSS